MEEMQFWEVVYIHQGIFERNLVNNIYGIYCMGEIWYRRGSGKSNHTESFPLPTICVYNDTAST